MYFTEDFLEMARKKIGKDWPTPDHEVVAKVFCLGNSSIKTMQTLIDYVGKIMKIPADKIRKVTHQDIYDMEW